MKSQPSETKQCGWCTLDAHRQVYDEWGMWTPICRKHIKIFEIDKSLEPDKFSKAIFKRES